ncbi:MAG: GTPase, partial [Candidatus Marinimicrobia bacterium]|nr:GTPase [Candidatus Neomarinimicrobiota bacterium]
AHPEDIEEVRNNIRELNPEALVIDAASPIHVDHPETIRGKRVLVVEDGPTLTHGEMQYGAGMVAAEKYGAAEAVDPRPFTVGAITKTFEKYPDIGELLPAMGYGDQQIKDLEETINKTDCDSVIIGTPIDLNRVLKINKPTARVSYSLQEIGEPTLKSVLEDFFSDI